MAAFRGNMAGMPPQIWDSVPDPVSEAWIEKEYPPVYFGVLNASNSADPPHS